MTTRAEELLKAAMTCARILNRIQNELDDPDDPLAANRGLHHAAKSWERFEHYFIHCLFPNLTSKDRDMLCLFVSRRAGFIDTTAGDLNQSVESVKELISTLPNEQAEILKERYFGNQREQP